MATDDTTGTIWKAWGTATTITASDSFTGSTLSIAYTANNNIVWTKWTSNYTISEAPNESAETRATREREAAEVRKREQEADQTAEQLLKECLSPKQEADYERARRFHVVSANGQRYEIDCTRRQHNVFRVGSDGKHQEELCAAPSGWPPLADNALAQKLMLETDEPAFRRIANIRQIA